MHPFVSCWWIPSMLLLWHSSNAFLNVRMIPRQPIVEARSLSARTDGTPTNQIQIQDTQRTNPSTEIQLAVGHSDRRKMIASSLASVFIYPSLALAGIDVSGLPVNTNTPNVDLVSQLQQAQYSDGSAARRVQDIRTTVNSQTSPVANRMNDSPVAVGVATWALRATEPEFKKLNFGTTNRYQGRIVGPAASKKSLEINFDFPADWLQLDKYNGCIQFVDQRNGDKLYVMRLTLPPDTTLATTPKQFFAKALFDPNGSLVTSGGLTVEDARVSKDITPPNCLTTNACGRRLLLKFATITGNGLRVERRGLVQAYVSPIDSNKVYMMVTSSNAVKFEKGGIERETVEKIVDSFRIESA